VNWIQKDKNNNHIKDKNNNHIGDKNQTLCLNENKKYFKYLIK